MGDQLLDGRRPGFYIIDNELIDTYGAKIGAYGVAVYNLLARMTGSGDAAFPSYQTIADKLKISRRQAVNVIEMLIVEGLIARTERRKPNGDLTSNLYTLIDLKGSAPHALVHDMHYPSAPHALPSAPHALGVVHQVHPKKTKLEEETITKTKGRRESGSVQSKPLPDTPTLPTPHQQMFGKICEVVGWDCKTIDEKSRLQLAQTAKILTEAGYTPADLDQWWDQVWKLDWRWTQKHSRPTLNQLRQEIGKVRTVSEIPAVDTKLPDYTNGAGRRRTKSEESLAAVDRVMARLEAQEAGNVSGEK